MRNNQINLGYRNLVAEAVSFHSLHNSRIFHHSLQLERFQVFGVRRFTIAGIHLEDLSQRFLMRLKASTDLILLSKLDNLRYSFQLRRLVLQLYVLISVKDASYEVFFAKTVDGPAADIFVKFLAHDDLGQQVLGRQEGHASIVGAANPLAELGEGVTSLKTAQRKKQLLHQVEVFHPSIVRLVIVAQNTDPVNENDKMAQREHFAKLVLGLYDH